MNERVGDRVCVVMCRCEYVQKGLIECVNVFGLECVWAFVYRCRNDLECVLVCSGVCYAVGL